MYEHVTYEDIMTRMLDRVQSEYPEVDTREGSLIYTAIAPAAIELAIMYSELDRVLEESFADTASLEYLERRTQERGISQRPASKAVMQGEFDVDVPLGSRFSLNEYNYVVVDAENGLLECEMAGAAPNTVFGDLTPIDTITGLTTATIISCLIPGEDDEDVEALRERYFDSLRIQSYGFNVQQYKEVVNDMDGVGATKVIPAWDGGGTVKLILLDSDYNSPSEELVSTVQETIDPVGSGGQGIGIAPIGHTVTVVAAGEVPVNIQTTFEYAPTYDWESVKANVQVAVDEYFTELSQGWDSSDIIVRINQINALLMSVQGVLDVTSTTINGGTANLYIDSESIPVRGTINGE